MAAPADEAKAPHDTSGSYALVHDVEFFRDNVIQTYIDEAHRDLAQWLMTHPAELIIRDLMALSDTIKDSQTRLSHGPSLLAQAHLALYCSAFCMLGSVVVRAVVHYCRARAHTPEVLELITDLTDCPNLQLSTALSDTNWYAVRVVASAQALYDTVHDPEPLVLCAAAVVALQKACVMDAAPQ